MGSLSYLNRTDHPEIPVEGNQAKIMYPLTSRTVIPTYLSSRKDTSLGKASGQEKLGNEYRKVSIISVAYNESNLKWIEVVQ